MTANSLSVSERVCLAKAEIAAIPKNGWNSHGKYKHATVDDVYNALRPILAKHDLDLKLDIRKADIVMRSTADRNGQSREVAWVYIEAGVGFEGEDAATRFIAVPMTGPQTYEIVNSYIQKQYLRARLQIETGEYDEEDMTKDNPPADVPKREPVFSLADGSLGCTRSLTDWEKASEDELRDGQKELFRLLRDHVASLAGPPETDRAKFLETENIKQWVSWLPEQGQNTLYSMATEKTDD